MLPDDPKSAECRLVQSGLNCAQCVLSDTKRHWPARPIAPQWVRWCAGPPSSGKANGMGQVIGDVDFCALGSAAARRARADEQRAALVQREATVRAFVCHDPDAPSASDRPLAGALIGVKDIIATADFPTAYGHAEAPGERREDAWCVARVRQLGGPSWARRSAPPSPTRCPGRRPTRTTPAARRAGLPAGRPPRWPRGLSVSRLARRRRDPPCGRRPIAASSGSSRASACCRPTASSPSPRRWTMSGSSPPRRAMRGS